MSRLHYARPPFTRCRKVFPPRTRALHSLYILPSLICVKSADDLALYGSGTASAMFERFRNSSFCTGHNGKVVNMETGLISEGIRRDEHETSKDNLRHLLRGFNQSKQGQTSKNRTRFPLRSSVIKI